MSRIWSPPQNAVFAWFANPVGHLLVRARAGCGKTTTIVEAVNYAGWAAKILVCAFNRSIADELSKRLKNPRAQAATLHKMGMYFCSKALGRGKATPDEHRGKRLAIKAIGMDKPPRQIVGLVRDLAGLGKNIAPFATVEQLHDIAVNFQLIPADEGHEESWTTMDVARAAHVAMELATKPDGTIDYDDMISLPIRMKWAFPFFDLVVVDEAQDMNPTQLLLAKAMCKRGGHIAIVGDDAQAIYGFRGADSQALDNLKRELSASELPLNITYRCPKKVVEIARTLVPDFTAAPEAPEGIVDRTGIKGLFQNVQAGDFVLSRSNAPLAKICLTLLKQGRRAVIRGRDIGATLRGIIDRTKTTTIVDLILAVKAWGASTIETMTAADAPEKAVEQVVDQVDTIIALSEGLATVGELNARLESLFSSNNDDAKDAVICSSVHKAKGLEAEHVFLLEDTLYPGRNRPDYVESEEEGNIHYVAVTRAKNHLTLVAGRP